MNWKMALRSGSWFWSSGKLAWKGLKAEQCWRGIQPAAMEAWRDIVDIVVSFLYWTTKSCSRSAACNLLSILVWRWPKLSKSLWLMKRMNCFPCKYSLKMSIPQTAAAASYKNRELFFSWSFSCLRPPGDSAIPVAVSVIRAYCRSAQGKAITGSEASCCWRIFNACMASGGRGPVL